ncbi:CDP-alcohol phosphatidyltransferase family protein [Nitrincola alkalisediminis]|uniref:CDP-alcohol phosphatidyltransferase family protein n=1 Tax=Nitrincola alkalisediminis TaxID=1366656 RepID=UPI001874B929|nr:CDP-alcohol phosphatidyltransferase family protein [Nitrincola alkalisediminis]
MAFSIYQLKSRFQDLLRPTVSLLYERGVTANQVTLLAALISVAFGTLLFFNIDTPLLFAFLPLLMLFRMGLNAIDGMLAREFKQASHLGAYLNELADLISDAALYLPFALLLGVHSELVLAIIFMALLSEYAGVLGPMIGGTRRYDGPMGKSDRAFVFGCLGLGYALGFFSAGFINLVLLITLLLLLLTLFNRIRKGIEDANKSE